MTVPYQDRTQARIQRLWARLDSLPASRRAMHMKSERTVLARRLLAGILLVSGTLGAALLWSAFAGLITRFSFGLALAMVGMLLIVAVIISCAEGVHEVVARKLWAVPLDYEQRKTLQGWAETYPSVHAACVRWSASRPGMEIHSIDYRRLEQVVENVEKFLTQLRDHEISLRATRDMLDTSGVLPAATAHRAHAEIATSTPASSVSSTPRRV